LWSRGAGQIRLHHLLIGLDGLQTVRRRRLFSDPLRQNSVAARTGKEERATLKWILLGALVLVVLIILEGKRQERIYGRPGRGSLVRTGLLELQRHLEPEKKVEIVLERRETTVESDSGDEPNKRENGLPDR
jgi:hypothetical protein